MNKRNLEEKRVNCGSQFQRERVYGGEKKV